LAVQEQGSALCGAIVHTFCICLVDAEVGKMYDLDFVTAYWILFYMISETHFCVNASQVTTTNCFGV
jgi:hypothetical protein